MKTMFKFLTNEKERFGYVHMIWGECHDLFDNLLTNYEPKFDYNQPRIRSLASESSLLSFNRSYIERI